IQLWGSCREGCSAQLPRMGLPRLDSRRGWGNCSHRVVPVKLGNSGEGFPDCPCLQ
ncbi:hypothetical protein HGM15179_010936, partial [Zosterops borbonicus]